MADPEEPEVALGALDTSDRMRDEEFLNFDDLDVPQQDVPTARPRGSYDDPISIQSEPARPARRRRPVRPSPLRPTLLPPPPRAMPDGLPGVTGGARPTVGRPVRRDRRRLGSQTCRPPPSSAWPSPPSP
jgi:hypothetical protein